MRTWKQNFEQREAAQSACRVAKAIALVSAQIENAATRTARIEAMTPEQKAVYEKAHEYCLTTCDLCNQHTENGVVYDDRDHVLCEQCASLVEHVVDNFNSPLDFINLFTTFVVCHNGSLFDEPLDEDEQRIVDETIKES